MAHSLPLRFYALSVRLASESLVLWKATLFQNLPHLLKYLWIHRCRLQTARPLLVPSLNGVPRDRVSRYRNLAKQVGSVLFAPVRLFTLAQSWQFVLRLKALGEMPHFVS